jgi:alanine dehydrogenase
MLIGIPKEIKKFECRVAATPDMVHAFIRKGHSVLVEKDGGAKVGFQDSDYLKAGAKIVDQKSVWSADLVLKVKEPQSQEYPLMKKGQILFCYLHLAPDNALTEALMDAQVTAIAYETVTDQRGGLPLLVPMSAIAGRIAIQAAALALQANHGGKGMLLGGIAGVLPAHVVIVGGGVVGTEAARMAVGLGAQVTILEKSIHRLKELDAYFGSRVRTLYSTAENLEKMTKEADVLIGAVLIPGKKAPCCITRHMVKQMSKGSVIVDVAIDQGGCVETSRPTTHGEPTYVEEGVIHYCVTNMPGACPLTSTYALTNATFSYAMDLAEKGFERAITEDSHLKEGVNVYKGHVTNFFVAQDQNLVAKQVCALI